MLLTKKSEQEKLKSFKKWKNKVLDNVIKRRKKKEGKCSDMVLMDCIHIGYIVTLYFEFKVDRLI